MIEKKRARHLASSMAMNAILDADLSYIRNSEMQEEQEASVATW